MHANHRDEDEEPVLVMAMAMAHLLSQGLLVGQRRPIVRRHHLIWESLECITRYRVILLGAQNEADRWVLPVQTSSVLGRSSGTGAFAPRRRG